MARKGLPLVALFGSDCSRRLFSPGVWNTGGVEVIEGNLQKGWSHGEFSSLGPRWNGRFDRYFSDCPHGGHEQDNILSLMGWPPFASVFWSFIRRGSAACSSAGTEQKGKTQLIQPCTQLDKGGVKRAIWSASVMFFVVHPEFYTLVEIGHGTSCVLKNRCGLSGLYLEHKGQEKTETFEGTLKGSRYINKLA